MAVIGPASFLLPSLFLSLPSPFICSFRPSSPGFAHGPLFASPAYSFCLFALLVLRAAPFRPTCLRARFALPLSCPLPPLSLFAPPLLFCFRPSLSAFALFVRISAVTVAHLGDISKKERLVTNEQMTRGTEGTAIGAHCALTRHYARRVYLERNAFARIVAKEWLFCYIAPFIWKKREIAERSEGRMGETNDGGKTREQARARRAKQSRARPMEQDVQDDRWGDEAKPRERRARRREALA